jgi:hypothetical protein
LDEVTDFIGNGWTARLAALAQSSPVISEPFFLPGDDGARLDELQGLLPAMPQAGEPHPEESIRWTQLETLDDVLINGELMLQGHVFEAQGFMRPKARYDVSDQG